ncbi:polyhydroxyalkanoate depolymerase [Paraburkholderia hospita]|uniref:polyhydroxyalkanoate depolymerase n=1 Tax=Paraburkholderia hospita TaxID=169430 RepID=UPI000B344B09|nr:polyhydroxyalkanoate depolymerase [Paraburkholderia hospita]OUL95707.1 polyhydroxyalkanoate depolymerase [Paraburkholderia hospita]
MLYALIDAQRRLTRAIAGRPPDECGSEPSAQAPWVTPGKAANAFRHWLLRSMCAFEQAPQFAISSVASNGGRITVDETLVQSLPTGTLRRFTRNPIAPEPAGKRPVLLCAPLAGHHAVMLRETVETLLEERDVFVTDWADARDAPREAGPFSLDDYVLALESFICAAHAQGSPVHLVAVCQASVPTLAAAALLASAQAAPFASVSLLGGPIDTRLNPTLVDRFAGSHTLSWFRENVIDVVPSSYRGAGRRVYPGFIQQAAIIAAHPERHLSLESAYWSNWLAGDMPGAMKALRSLNEYAAVLDMAECYFLDIIRVVFHEHLLPRKTWVVAGQRVETDALRETPICTMEGDRDDITGAGQNHCAHELCKSLPARPDRQLTVPQCNHYDLFTGSRWRDAVHPSLCNFWREVETAALGIRRKRGEASHADRRRQA